MLRIHRAERADRLLDALAQVVRGPLDDPFRAEIVAVPSRGVERWLSQRLSAQVGTSPGGSDGVCANMAFPFPGRLVAGAVAAATGQDPGTDPWLPERSVWPLLEVVEELAAESWLAPVSAHLRGPAGPGGDRASRRLAALRHLAELFDRYGLHRPAMLEAWAAGQDTDGDGRALPGDLAWQAELWRRLRDRLGTEGPAERLMAACRQLREDPSLSELPSRLSMFGLTRLPASHLEVLSALASARDVHLFLLHPSPVLWERIAAASHGPGLEEAGMARHPLLASWGQDARDMQSVLAGGRDAMVDQHHSLDQPALSLLAQLQADIRADRVPPGLSFPDRVDERPVLGAGDTSLQVHSCHGRARQVEALRDAILHLLAADPTLEQRDIIVMCPDIDVFAPLINAAFGASSPDEALGDPGLEVPAGGHHLQVRLADRSIRQTNPVLAVTSELLSLVTARLSTPQVVDLAGREPVRRRFSFDDDDMARIEEWVEATGVRWGLDAGHRAAYKLGQVGANTWRAGLDRVLVGVSMAEEGLRLVGGVLPLDDVDSGDIDLAGRLAELVDRLHTAVTSLAGARTVAGWVEAIADAVDSLTATDNSEAWQRAQLGQILDEVLSEATIGGAPSGARLELDEIRVLLADRLRGRPTRANFRTGHLTMCTLVPMRSVPHRVVCLLGLDDGSFPRPSPPDGDDLLARSPRPGDRDPRREDRQLLLDALMAATDHVVITYTGRDERTNALRPPAVPLGELLDVVDATVSTGDPSVPARHRVLVRHPLQSFDARNFTAGAMIPGPPWSFDPIALAGARASLSARMPPPGFLERRLPAMPGQLIELEDLVRFVQHPVKAFLRQRLGIVLRSPEARASDALPVEMDKLEEWGVGQRLLEGRLAGSDIVTCRTAEVARGLLPPGQLGSRLVDRIIPVVEGIAAAARRDGQAEAGSVEIDVDLGDGRRLVGTVSDVARPRGGPAEGARPGGGPADGARPGGGPADGADDLLRSVTYSRIGAKHRLASWVRLLALSAGHPERACRAVVVGRGARRQIASACLGPLGEDAESRARVALAHLVVLVDLYDRGMREPLPIYCRTSAAYSGARAAGHDAPGAARREWESGFNWSREDAEPEHRLVLGRISSFDDLLAVVPREDECGAGWPCDETTRLGSLAWRLWEGLLGCETTTSL